MTDNTKSHNISNSISASFNKPNNSAESPGQWSISYDPESKSLSLNVDIEPSFLIDEPNSSLISTIDPEGLTDMLEFLMNVNRTLQDNSSNH